MKIDTDFLYEFERGLDPQKLERSRVPAVTLGFGEISTIFQIGHHTDVPKRPVTVYIAQKGINFKTAETDKKL